jgi:hypothetical protein
MRAKVTSKRRESLEFIAGVKRQRGKENGLSADVSFIMREEAAL